MTTAYIDPPEDLQVKIIDIWHISKAVHPTSRYDRLLYTTEHGTKLSPKLSRGQVYKFLTRTV